MKKEQVAIITLALGILLSCSKKIDTPTPPENKAPTLEITNLDVNDATNHISFDAKATDTDGEIASYDAFLTKENGEKQNLVVNSEGHVDEPISNHGQYRKLTVSATDNDGATTKSEKSIALVVENITTGFVAETTITPNDINEETAGKIAELSTVVNKTVNTDGNETTTLVTDGNIDYTITGADANLLEIAGNEVRVKAGMGKDAEDINGQNIEANQTYSFGIDTNVSGLENGNTATDTDTAESQNIDLVDYAPTIEGKQLTGLDGEVIVVEHENAKRYQDYVKALDLYDPENLVAINNGSVQDLIDASNGAFVGEILADGNKYAKIVSGVHAGKHISAAAQEAARSAISRTLDNAVDILLANKILGNLYTQISQDADAFDTTISSSTGQHFLTPKENAKIAGLATIVVGKAIAEDLQSE